MLEHVGTKNYRDFMQIVHSSLSKNGLALIHTIGGNESMEWTDPWIHKYIFPNSTIPSAKQLTQAWENLLVFEDWQNFGLDYDKTLLNVAK